MPGPDGFTRRRPDARRRPGADPRRVRRERRGRQGPGARHRRRRLPDQAVRQGRAAGPDRGDHAPRRPAGRRRVRAAGRSRPATSSWSRAVTRPASARRSLTLTPDRVPPARGARPRRRRHRPAPPAGAGRLAGRDRPGPALAQAAPRPPAREGRGGRRAARSWRSAASAIGSSSTSTRAGPPAGPRDRARDRQTATATARPLASCAASAQSTRQPRASRPASGLKWNHASPLGGRGGSRTRRT